MPDDGLVVNLESLLPAALPAGSATAVFCSGTCFHRRERIARLELVVGGERHRPAAFAMPRPDLYDATGERRAFRSGFWGTVPVVASGAVELGVAVRLASGRELE